MSNDHHRILLLGRVASAEMRGVRDAVFAMFADADIRATPVMDEDEVSEWSPHLVVVCQSQPDEFITADVHVLLRRYPLARFVCAAGLWCESDGRNRDVWPIGVRIPARIAAQRLRNERSILDGQQSPLPLTAGREEAFEFDSTAAMPLRSGELNAIVLSPDVDLKQRFETDLRDGGYVIADDSIDLLLWDADPGLPERLADLRRLRRQHPDAVIVALANFAPPEDEQQLIRAGADVVCGKLTTGSELCRVIDTLSKPPGRAPADYHGTPLVLPSTRRPCAS